MLTSGLAIVGLLIACIDASGQPISSERVQWKQSIERPSRGWDYDGKRILGHIGHDVCLWDAETGELLQRMKGHQEQIHRVQFSPDGNHALSSSWARPGPMVPIISRDTRVILWNLGTGRERNSFQGQVAGEFSPDGKRIVTFSQRPGTGQPDPSLGESTVPSTGEVWQLGSEAKFDAAIWDADTGRQLVKAKLDERNDPYNDTLHFSPDASRFVHLYNGGFLPYNTSGGVLFNAGDGREIGRITRDDLKFGQGHRYTSSGAIASFGPESARLIDLKSGRVVQSIEHDMQALWGEVWTHDGRKVAAIDPDGAIKICDIESGITITGAKGGPYPQRIAIISPDNSRLAVVSGGVHVEKREVEPQFGLYDLNTGAELTEIKLAKQWRLVGFSPDSKTLLVGGPEFVIYDAVKGTRIRTLTLRIDP
jgi:WD40 repeat protein